MTSIEIRSRAPFAEGAEFGSAGAYERIAAVLHFAVDPAAELNQGIADLDCAERGSDGLVHFEADLVLLRPANAALGSGKLLCSVVNRGRTALLPFSHPPAGFVPGFDERIEPGDGFLLGRGWTIALCGWQWDVIRRPGALGLAAPLALDAGGQPAETDVTVQFQPLTARESEYLGHWPAHPRFNRERMHQPYPPADVNDPAASLSVADRPGDAGMTLPRSTWRFARVADGTESPDPQWVTLDGGFQPGRIYSLVFRTNRCPVVGTGLLAIRDAASFLRNGSAASGNPVAGEVRSAFAHGVSQTGRFLREFLHRGLNVDEEGRQVFDAVYPLVAGARRGEFNFRGAQPSAQYVFGPGHLPPFAAVPTSDESRGLYDLQRTRGGMPRLFEVNTANEYWRSNAALVHSDPERGLDFELPPDMRVYLFSGCQHGSGPPSADGYGAAHAGAAACEPDRDAQLHPAQPRSAGEPRSVGDRRRRTAALAGAVLRERRACLARRCVAADIGDSRRGHAHGAPAVAARGRRPPPGGSLCDRRRRERRSQASACRKLRCRWRHTRDGILVTLRQAAKAKSPT